MLNRTIAPENNPILSVQLPQAEIFTLPSGARLHCISNHQQDILKLEIVVKAGKWYEPIKGVSYFTAKMLLEGNVNYTAKQLAEKIAYYGASLESNQSFDRSSVTLYCLSKHFTNLFPLVMEVLTQPTFPEEEFNLLKKRTLQNISIEKQKNSYLATLLLTENIYGKSHPYVAGMEEDDIEAVSNEHVKRFYETNFLLADAEIFFSGAITKEHIQQLKKELNSGEPASIKEKPFIQLSPSLREDKLETSNNLQTSIRIGCSWPLMGHPDFAKLSILNKILGGYFGSRLMKNIREEKGYTYGIFSAVSPKENDSLFYIGTDIKSENKESTLVEIYKEIGILQSEAISIEELETVKNYTIGKFLNETATIFDQSDKYKTITLKNLPIDYYVNYINDIRNVTPQDILKLSKDYLTRENLFQVTVGA